MTTNEKYTVIELSTIGGTFCSVMEILDGVRKSLKDMDGEASKGMKDRIDEVSKVVIDEVRALNRKLARTIAEIQA